MCVLFWIAFGVVAGLLTWFLTPGQRRPTAAFVLVVLGTLGALLGGFAGEALGLYPSTHAAGALVTAVLGAVVLLALYHAAFAQRRVY